MLISIIMTRLLLESDNETNYKVFKEGYLPLALVALTGVGEETATLQEG